METHGLARRSLRLHALILRRRALSPARNSWARMAEIRAGLRAPW
jgi:hypothetical protein